MWPTCKGGGTNQIASSDQKRHVRADALISWCVAASCVGHIRDQYRFWLLTRSRPEKKPTWVCMVFPVVNRSLRSCKLDTPQTCVTAEMIITHVFTVPYQFTRSKFCSANERSWMVTPLLRLVLYFSRWSGGVNETTDIDQLCDVIDTVSSHGAVLLSDSLILAETIEAR